MLGLQGLEKDRRRWGFQLHRSAIVLWGPQARDRTSQRQTWCSVGRQKRCLLHALLGQPSWVSSLLGCSSDSVPDWPGAKHNSGWLRGHCWPSSLGSFSASQAPCLITLLSAYLALGMSPHLETGQGLRSLMLCGWSFLPSNSSPNAPSDWNPSFPHLMTPPPTLVGPCRLWRDCPSWSWSSGWSISFLRVGTTLSGSEYFPGVLLEPPM